MNWQVERVFRNSAVSSSETSFLVNGNVQQVVRISVMRFSTNWYAQTVVHDRSNSDIEQSPQTLQQE
jgi:hypothetical protein